MDFKDLLDTEAAIDLLQDLAKLGDKATRIYRRRTTPEGGFFLHPRNAGGFAFYQDFFVPPTGC